MGLTGKQAAFVNAYLGEARFNATAAAKRAGYRANSKHSFESIGSENLTRPRIRAAIDEHFRMSRMSAEEVLIELTILARGNSKDKLRALALMSAHHGILDGRYEKLTAAKDLAIQAKYERGWAAAVDAMEQEVNEYNAKADKSNLEKEAQWQAVIDRYQHSTEAVRALTELREIMLGRREPPTGIPKPVEVEILPPQRRLASAPIERMMAEIIEAEPQPPRCSHGNLEGECCVVDVGYDCPHWYRKKHASGNYYA